MKRLLFGAVMAGVLLLPGLARAQSYQLLNLFNAATVNGTSAVQSGVRNLAGCDVAVSVFVTASSTIGAADVKLEYAVCSQTETSGAANCGSFVDTTDLVASTNTDFTTNPEGLHAVALPALLSSVVDFKVTGVGTNPADTVVTADLLCKRK